MSEYRGIKIEFAFTEHEIKDMYHEMVDNQQSIDACPTIWKFVTHATEHVDV